MLIRFNAPLPANPGMENLFERDSFSGVLKDYGAKRGPIQVPFTGEDAKPKLAEQLLFNLVKLDQFVRGFIGVKKSCGRKNLAQAIAKSRLARGNSAGDPDDRHLVMEYWRNGVLE